VLCEYEGALIDHLSCGSRMSGDKVLLLIWEWEQGHIIGSATSQPCIVSKIIQENISLVTIHRYGTVDTQI